jgi:hypothetical protein
VALAQIGFYDLAAVFASLVRNGFRARVNCDRASGVSSAQAKGKCVSVAMFYCIFHVLSLWGWYYIAALTASSQMMRPDKFVDNPTIEKALHPI